MYNPQLETFIRVADAGSFNKAAEESYITPTVQRFLDAAKELRNRIIWLTVITYRYILQNKARLLWRYSFFL